MIIRHIPMKKARASSYSGLVQYLSNDQNKQERVGEICLSNCTSMDPVWAVQEVLATQAKNQRAKGDKTYHMLISFSSSERPTDEVLRELEERVVSSIGFKEHQRISVVHHDTDNLHIHIAINKIHPQTYHMIEPYRAYKTFAEVASKLEVEFGLRKTNHQTRKGRSENLADDMERHSGIESLINWMKCHCKEKIEEANDWAAVHCLLAENGLQLRSKANGLVFCNAEGLTVKASSISRNFSLKNLESRLGVFVPFSGSENIATSNCYRYEPLNIKLLDSKLYEIYQLERVHRNAIRTERLKQLRLAKGLLIERTKRGSRIKRAALKLMNFSRTNKKFLYQRLNKKLLEDIANIQKNYSNVRARIIDKYENKTWSDWLKNKAQTGDQASLTALRYQNRKNKNRYSLSGTVTGISSVDISLLDSVTKEGTAIYKIGNGVIRDNGNEINISKGGSIASLTKALEIAQQRYGNCIRVNGSALFKEIILHIVIQTKLPITFAESAMEGHRQKLISNKETRSGQKRNNRPGSGRGASGSYEATGGRTKNGRSNIKPDAFSFKRNPAAESQNSLRKLSQLDVVQFTSGSKVLLQNHAPDKLERQGFKSDNHVRWKTFRLGKNKGNKL